jgi:hypothetical protein
MKKIFLLVFLLLFPVISYAQPSIQFEEESYDFGEVEAGEAVEHIFEFTNTGNEELVIEKLVPS